MDDEIIKSEEEMMEAARKLKVGEHILVDSELPVGYRLAEICEMEFEFNTLPEDPDGVTRVTRRK